MRPAADISTIKYSLSRNYLAGWLVDHGIILSCFRLDLLIS